MTDLEKRTRELFRPQSELRRLANETAAVHKAGLDKNGDKVRLVDFLRQLADGIESYSK